MRNVAILVGIHALAGCSLEHIVVAALDESGGGGAAAEAGTTNAARAGAASLFASAGAGGLGAAGGALPEGDAGRVSITSGGVVDNTVIGTLIAAGGDAQMHCSCLGHQAQVCGTDGLTYPRDCGDAGTCAPPEIACLNACPCLDGGLDNGGSSDFFWFPKDCVPMAQCSEGVVCMGFSDGTLNDTQSTCSTSN